MKNSNRKFDLEERTARFGEEIIESAQKIKRDCINMPLISQLVRSSTSIGANYMEANGAESKKDFIHKIQICKKEAKETMHWLRMIAKINPDNKLQIQKLWQEAKELTLIFAKISQSK